MKFGKASKIVLALLMGAMTIVGLSGLSYIFVSYNQAPSTTSSVYDTVTDITLTASDDVTIAATYYPVDQPRGWVVYSHMMPSDRTSFVPLATRLSRAGYAGIAIDLRGHGQSQGGPDTYLQFSDAQHQASVRDIEAAVNFLVQQGANASDVVLVGASIGANLSLVYGAQHSSAVVALSPGLSYHGVDALAVTDSYQEKGSVLLVGSSNDPNVVGDDAQIRALDSAMSEGVVSDVLISEVPYHGTDILVHDESVEDAVLLFITNH